MGFGRFVMGIRIHIERLQGKRGAENGNETQSDLAWIAEMQLLGNQKRETCVEGHVATMLRLEKFK